MQARVWGIALAAIVASMSVVHAQELRCTQIFMNASEKRICGTPELLELDQQMGAFARRAASTQDSYKGDQKQFRKSLKSCKGEASCLTALYETRIRDLQAFVETLPPPTAEELAVLAAGAQQAEEKRSKQIEARVKIAKELSRQQPSPLPVESHQIQAPIAEAPDARAAQTLPVESSTQPPSVDQQGGGIGDWWLLIMLGLGLVGAIVLDGIRGLLERIRRACPKCNNWNVDEVLARNSRSHTDFETRRFEDVHKDRQGNRTGSTVKKRQIQVRVTNTVETLRCTVCEHVWELRSQSRSS